MYSAIEQELEDKGDLFFDDNIDNVPLESYAKQSFEPSGEIRISLRAARNFL